MGIAHRPKGCLTPAEVASLCGVKRETIAYWIKKGRLAAAQSPHNRSWWIREADAKKKAKEYRASFEGLDFKTHG